MQNELQRVLNLAKKTGDRVIVFDHFDNEKTYVVMGLDEYEGIVDRQQNAQGDLPPEASAKGGLTEVELLDKINGDIAQWKNTSDFNIPEESKRTVEPKKPEVKAETAKPAKKSNWSIPKTIKEAAEQVMEEDKGYSEEVNF